MKKLMIALAVAACAAVSNAANVNWSLSNFYTPKATAEGTITVSSTANSTGAKAADGVIAFELFVIDNNSSSATYGDHIKLDGKTVTFSEAGKMASTTLFTQADAVTMRDTYGNSGSLTLELIGKYSDADYEYVYTSTVSKNLNNILSAAQTYTFLGSTTGAWTATAVPEPTSGILMLLGVAGLALRRRRA